MPPLLIFLVEKFANINPVILGWSFSLRKKVSCKHIMSGICFCLLSSEMIYVPLYIPLSSKSCCYMANRNPVFTLYNISQTSRYQNNIIFIYCRAIVNATHLGLHLTVLVRKKKPVLSNTGRFFCFNSTVSYTCQFCENRLSEK